MAIRRTDHTDGAAQNGPRALGDVLVPGAVIGDGRYRLLSQFGADRRGNACFWRARDGQLRRDVALTVLVGDPTDRNATVDAQRTLERATHAARFSHPAMSRVLDVLGVGGGVDPSEGVLGVVVSDWAQGTDLIDLIAEHPLPAGTAARLLEPLAAAVEQSHHSGLVLGVDHPQRIRVSPEGTLRLAFPGPLPHATPQDDVKGLGAVLYLLLTGRWALRGGPADLPMAPRSPNGSVVPPSALMAGIPEELSALAVQSLDDASLGGIRTSAAVLRVLELAAQRAELADRTELLTPVTDEGRGNGHDNQIWTTRRPVQDSARRRKLAIGVTALTVATVGILAWVGMQFISFFGDSAPSAGGGPVVVATTPAPQPGEDPQNKPPPAPQPAGPVAPKTVQVYSVKGDKDNARHVGRILDGNAKTTWSTGKYKQPFPSLKPGIGVMATFEDAVKLAALTVDTPSDGTVVEIRVAAAPDTRFDQTKLITSATLGAGRTDIPLPAAEPGKYVLVWITKLGGGGRENVTQIREIVFTRAQ